MRGSRGYDDPCGIARALDVLGERWALLVVRELLLGPKRFTDLRRGLPGVSQNVLSQRLRELADSGVLRRRTLGPPVGGQVYELTERGRDLEPVLFQLASWGSRTPLTTDSELGVDAMLFALKTTFDAEAAADLRTTCELRLGDDLFRVTVDGGTVDLARGGADRPDAVISCGTAVFRSLVFGGRPPTDAQEAGDLEVSGDVALAHRLLRLFPRPTAS